ncbi:helix-turn-helix transcriptional regulator [Brevibacillus borstelensis]|nr:helix-turn-helix transcriptional regulator [Brevibacillus borstelensis]
MLGKWLYERGIKQQWLINETGISRSTISDACSKEGRYPSYPVMVKIVAALKRIDPTVSIETFWPTENKELQE